MAGFSLDFFKKDAAGASTLLALALILFYFAAASRMDGAPVIPIAAVTAPRPMPNPQQLRQVGHRPPALVVDDESFGDGPRAPRPRAGNGAKGFSPLGESGDLSPLAHSHSPGAPSSPKLGSPSYAGVNHAHMNALHRDPGTLSSPKFGVQMNTLHRDPGTLSSPRLGGPKAVPPRDPVPFPLTGMSSSTAPARPGNPPPARRSLPRTNDAATAMGLPTFPARPTRIAPEFNPGASAKRPTAGSVPSRASEMRSQPRAPPPARAGVEHDRLPAPTLTQFPASKAMSMGHNGFATASVGSPVTREAPRKRPTELDTTSPGRATLFPRGGPLPSSKGSLTAKLGAEFDYGGSGGSPRQPSSLSARR